MKKSQVMIGFLQKQKFFYWRFSSRLRQLVCAACALAIVGTGLKAEDTFEPYASDVPESAVALWENYDPRHEPLNIEVAQEWENDGVVTRYVTFTVGTFKGTESRIAAYYCLPSRKRNFSICVGTWWWPTSRSPSGEYFARQGYASIDISAGRPLEDGIDTNTDWGASTLPGPTVL